MSGVFRRRWFPRRQAKVSLPEENSAINLTGVSSTTAVATLILGSTTTVPTVSVSADAGDFSPNYNVSVSGVDVTADLSIPFSGPTTTVPTVIVSVDVGDFSPIYDVSVNGVVVTADLSLPIPGLDINLPILTATQTQIGVFTSTAPGPRTFWISGIQQKALAPGIVLFPTSEDLTLANAPYVIGSSQFYTVGEVHWNGTKRVHGVDWNFVQPFNHIIEILVNPNTINTLVTLIYYRWDIGMRAGFQVTSYPVEFAFDRTSIIAERVPPVNSFFTVSYSDFRPGTNPVTMFARYPIIIDDVLANHLSYDGINGFDTYRPTGYKVFDIDDNLVYTWNGSIWGSGVSLAINTMFYAKRQRSIYVYDGLGPTVLFQSGDTINNTYPETITYPVFGESIGKNLLQDAFSANAAIQYPSAYEIAQRPGFYDDWLGI